MGIVWVVLRKMFAQVCNGKRFYVGLRHKQNGAGYEYFGTRVVFVTQPWVNGC